MPVLHAYQLLHTPFMPALSQLIWNKPAVDLDVLRSTV